MKPSLNYQFLCSFLKHTRELMKFVWHRSHKCSKRLTWQKETPNSLSLPMRCWRGTWGSRSLRWEATTWPRPLLSPSIGKRFLPFLCVPFHIQRFPRFDAFVSRLVGSILDFMLFRSQAPEFAGGFQRPAAVILAFLNKKFLILSLWVCAKFVVISIF